MALVAGLVAFLVVQVFLEAYDDAIVREAVEHGWLEPGPFESMSPWWSLLAGATGYSVLALAGSAIALRGHRILASLPAAAFVFASVVEGRDPEPLGFAWALPCYAPVDACPLPWFANPWLAASMDVTLITIPLWFVGRSVVAHGWPGPVDATTIAAVATSVASVATVWWALWAIRSYADVRAIVTTAVVGIVLGVARPWWPWLHVLVAAFAAGSLWFAIDLVAWLDPTYPIGDALIYALDELWPIIVVGLIAAAWQPLAWTLRRLRERPLRLVAAVNALNVVDAVMTFVAVRSGDAYEVNPVVQAAGLPAKLVFVGLLSWILYLRKPTALIWPTAALLWVGGYHVAGFFVNDVR